MTAQYIFEWLKKKGYQTGDLEQEYKGYYDVDMPKILNDFLNENQNQPTEKAHEELNEMTFEEYTESIPSTESILFPEKAQEEQSEMLELILDNYREYLNDKETTISLSQFIKEELEEFTITRKHHD